MMSVSLRVIFDLAVELPIEQRADYLAVHCGTDVKLRAAVESLLASHDRAGSFLADPAVPIDLLQAREQLSRGSRIGKYALLKVLGEGGYGTVYLAEQDPPLRRRVALKVIKPGMDSRQVSARFDLERQSLAALDHPNIAKVFDAGSTAAGHPFFVMELVEGVPITECCTSYELNIVARLRIFTAVCAAVQHAHETGVIHRDLKPGNILVGIRDGNPVPKVIDFGIAKALQPTSAEAADPITVQPQFLGTPQYMSPEQARLSAGELDWRTDVYSLGVLLYELLTDTPPFDRAQLDAAAFGDIARILQEVDPPPPSARLAATNPRAPHLARRQLEARARLPQVRGDLDRIVMKAMEKSADRRYQSAASLAADVENHLAGVPISASGRSWGHRGRLAIHRHRRALTVAALFLLGVAAGMLALANWRADDENVRAPRRAAATSPSSVLITFEGGETQLDLLVEGVRCFTNRRYAFQNLPPEVVGCTFTRRAAGMPMPVTFEAPAGSIVYLLMNSDQNKVNGNPALNVRLLATGWVRLADCSYAAKNYPVAVYKRQFPARGQVTLTDALFSGFILAARKLTLVAPTATLNPGSAEHVAHNSPPH